MALFSPFDDRGGAGAEATGLADVCWHCGAALGLGRRVPASLRGRHGDEASHEFCCHGCVAVARLLADLPPRDNRTQTTAVPEVVEEGVASLDGLSCASCAPAIELGLQTLPGVVSSRVDAVARRLYVSWDPAVTAFGPILRRVRRLGYGARPFDVARASEEVRSAARRRLQRMLLATLCMMQVMMLSVPMYLANANDMSADIAQLLRYAQLMLSAPVLTFCAWPIYRGAWRDLRLQRLGMDIPVTLALLIAAAASLWAVLRQDGAIYFDSVTMFIALLLVSRWFQERGLERAAAYLDALAAKHDVLATRLTDYPASMATESVPASALAVGDLLWVRPGETFAADGSVVSGFSACSEALLTGESQPVAKQPGMPVLASGINLEQPLVVRVTRCGDDTTLAALTRMAQEAAHTKPQLVETAERAARYFLYAIFALVVLAAGWWALHDPAQIVPVSIAILIVTCPCALSLAVPVTLAAAQGALARHGVLVTNAAAIETLGHVDHVAFDKTGTLTTGVMRLHGISMLSPAMNEAAALALAAQLESASNHPIAVALRAAVSNESIMPLGALTVFPGEGVEASLAEEIVRLGSRRFVQNGIRNQPDPALPAAAVDADSRCYLGNEHGLIAEFRLADSLRSDSADLISQLREQGKGISMLSGDSAAAVARIAASLGIDDDQNVMANASPEAKRTAVQTLQRAGHVVAMVGDGLNDAPVIAQADVSVALAGAATLAQTRADFIILSDRLGALVDTFAIGQRAQKIIRQNLAWALLYNLVAIPVAASGFVAPLWAGLGMVLSSLLVVGNGLRLLPRGNVISTTPELIEEGVPA